MTSPEEPIFQGAADVYRLVKETSLRQETPEDSKSDRAIADIITTLSQEALGVKSQRLENRLIPENEEC
ncbi:hypothetical protein H6G04_16380 [Calothrix membranacea FACHB-236]|nr:hypothetical protein [Calothrix membranacea FACHB-236]